MLKGGFFHHFVLATCCVAWAGAAPVKMTYLDNGQIRLGLNLNMGGAISYLAKSGGGSNLINSWDFGREVQLSFYSGPIPFQPPGAKLDPAWKALGWNPIQAGDAFGHGSRVLELNNDGKRIHLRCVPMIWPLDNVPAECVFECDYQLKGNAVEVENHLLNARSDHTHWSARGQELPAVYSNGAWYKLVSYTGDAPFTGQPATTLVDLNDGKGWPWLTFYGTGHWAALLDKNDRGLGVFEPDAIRFGGGFAGKPKGSGGPKNDQTGYIAPNLDEILDYNIDYFFRYSLIVGSLAEIRQYASDHTKPVSTPAWTFKNDREHWTYSNAGDTGWPVLGQLHIQGCGTNSEMISPETFWKAEAAPFLEFEAAYYIGRLPERTIPVSIETAEHGWIGPILVPIQGDGRRHKYRAKLAGTSGYVGAMRRLKLGLPPGEDTWVKSIRLTNR